MLWLHRYAKLLAASSLLLIAVGGLVTSTGSGLAVPDWPNTYGYFMFSFPLSKMVGGIFYEHGHRLIASTVGLMTIGLAMWLAHVEPRRWVRQLGWLAFVAVVTQGILGGVTVLFFLPAPISISHAGLAQIFFTLVVSLAIFTSPGWRDHYRRPATVKRALAGDRPLRVLAMAAPGLIYLQVLIGATMRHTGAGLAIPDFPLSFGGFIPPVWNAGIAIHFAHRVGAVMVSAVVFALAGHVLAHWRSRAELVRPAMLLMGIVCIQVVLGAWTVLSERDVAVNSAHVATGALLLVSAVGLTLTVFRDRFEDVDTFSSPSLTSPSSPGVRA